MLNYHINNYEQTDFDSYTFKDSQGEDVVVEGRKWYIEYVLKPGAKSASQLQIIRNYTNAVKQVGGVVEMEGEYNAYLKLKQGDSEVWVHVEVGEEWYTLNIIEKGELIQEVEASLETADKLAQGINTQGKAAIYGIHFDTGKAEIKPESEPVLKEVAKLLSESPSLKLYIVGHTDNVGEFEYNMKLSQARAEAVVKELVEKHSVSEDRIKPYGIGPLAPVASNKTEEGRAKNRRVELIEQ
jgi:outer membrane protein OmpA-like peptidoglycan-associated protein